MRRLLRFVPLVLLTLACALPPASQKPPPMSANEMAQRDAVQAGLQPRSVQVTPSAVASPPPPEPTVDETLRMLGIESPDAGPMAGGAFPRELQDGGVSELQFMNPPPPRPLVLPPVDPSEVRSSRPSGAASRCPGGVTTDGDCCRTGCACGASCISCSSRCRR
jgi:hypothetical protein